MRIGTIILTLGLAASAWGQVERTTAIDCSVDGRTQTCDRGEFLKRFAEVKTLSLESVPRDRVADGQLASLSKSLGKTVVSAAADLTLRVVRAADSGFAVGTGDEELGSLRVIVTKDGASRLLWIERYRGQPDTPWQAVVRGLTQQLQESLAGR